MKKNGIYFLIYAIAFAVLFLSVSALPQEGFAEEVNVDLSINEFMSSCMESGGQFIEIEGEEAGISTISCGWEWKDGSETVMECETVSGGITGCDYSTESPLVGHASPPFPPNLIRDQKDFRKAQPTPPIVPPNTPKPETMPIPPSSPPSPPPPAEPAVQAPSSSSKPTPKPEQPRHPIKPQPPIIQ